MAGRPRAFLFRFGRRWYLLSRAMLTTLHSGPASSAVLHGAPTGLEYKLAPDLFRTLVLEMRQVSEAHCECGLPLDVPARHVHGPEG